MVVVVFCQLWSLERSIKIIHYFYSTDLLLLLFLSNKNDRENLGEFCPLTSLFLEILLGILYVYILLHPVILYIVSFSLIKNLQTVTLYFLGFESLLSVIVIIFLPAYYCPVRDSQVPLIVPAYELWQVLATVLTGLRTHH